MNRQLALRWLLGLAIGAAIAAVPLLHSPSTSATRNTDAFWEHFYLNGVSEEASSLADLAHRSDLIVVAKLGNLQESRSWIVHESLAANGVAFYAKTDLAVEEIVSAKDPADGSGSVALELFVPVPSRFAEIAASEPVEERALMFLIHTPDNPKTFSFAVLNSSYFRDGGKARPPVGAASEWLEALGSVSFDELVDRVRFTAP